MLPPAYVHYQLSLEMLFENLDYVGSVQYAYASAARAFNSTAAKFCSDGREVEPVLQHQCPSPTAVSELKPCGNAEVGEACTDAQDCGWSEPAGNCPLKSVYKKVVKSCRGRGAWFCEKLAKVIAAVSAMTMTLAMLMPQTALWALYPPEHFDPDLALCCCCLPQTVCFLIVVLPVFWAVGGAPAMIVFWVMTCIGIVFVMASVMCLFLKGFKDALAKRVAMMAVPMLNIYVSWRMGAEAAAEVKDTIKPMFVFLRIANDLPELICNILDMYFFGVTWSAAFDLTTSTLEMLYHLTSAAFWCLYRCLKRTKVAVDVFIETPATTVGTPS